jgi:DNA (cytosine-5)-methyltransferase 1
MPIKYIDLFCGIGGFHQAISRVFPDATCVLASDIDPAARSVYAANYGITPVGDICTHDVASIPPFDLLCGGFPCQAFSAAGKKNGFDDPRGTLFFDILRIVDHHTPSTLILENVANLCIIDEGRIFQTILHELTSRGYKVSHAVLTPHQFGIPQSRDRVYIVASKTQTFDFAPLVAASSDCTLRSILEPATGEYMSPDKYVLLDPAHVKTQSKSGIRFCGYMKGELRKTGARPNTEHLSRSHKQTCRIHSVEGTQPTLAASETSGRYHIYDGTGVRKLTLNECYRLMDFPSTFQKHPTKGTAYKQIGNSVCVKVVEAIVTQMRFQGVV